MNWCFRRTRLLLFFIKQLKYELLSIHLFILYLVLYSKSF